MRKLMSMMAFVCLATAAGAQEEAPQEPEGLHFAPHVRGSALYDSNVFLERRGAEDDFALSLEPGVEATWRRSKLRAGADVGLDGHLYFQHEELNELFWDASAFVEYEPREDFRLRLEDRYVPQALQLGAPEDTVVNQQQANWLTGEAVFDREVQAKTDLELGLRGTRFDTRGFDAAVDLDGDGMLEEARVDVDYWEARGWLEGRRELSRDRELFARLESARRVYPDLEIADFTEYAGTLGFRAALTSRIRLDVGVGWGYLDFDAQDGESRFVGEMGLTWELPREWTLRLSGGRSLSSNVVGTDFGETHVRFEVQKELGRRTRVIASVYWSEFENNALEQDANEVIAGELRVQRDLTARIRAELGWRRWVNAGDFENDDFTQDRILLALVYRY